MFNFFFSGNYSFYAEANPLLYDVIMQASKSVSWHGDEGDRKEQTVYDIWRERGRRSADMPDKPW